MKNITFKIEKGIPHPDKKRNIMKNSKYPFAKMKKGESVAVPMNIFRKAASAAYTYGHILNNEKKFSARRVSQFEGRIWRIK